MPRKVLITKDTLQEILEKYQGGSSGTSINAPAQTIANVTYQQLVALKNNAGLIPGNKYRIIDYETIVNENLQIGDGTQNISIPFVYSAGHNFDIIVEAKSTNELYADARAALHQGDDYFANNNLDLWELKYDIENDSSKYLWANQNGKGVIYWLKDEFENECPYDFKNIMYVIYSLKYANKIYSEQMQDEYNDTEFFEVRFFDISDSSYLSQQTIDNIKTSQPNSIWPKGKTSNDLNFVHVSLSHNEEYLIFGTLMDVINALIWHIMTASESENNEGSYKSPFSLRKRDNSLQLDFAVGQNILNVLGQTLNQDFLKNNKAMLVYTFNAFGGSQTGNYTYCAYYQSDLSLKGNVCYNNKIMSKYYFSLDPSMTTTALCLPCNIFFNCIPEEYMQRNSSFFSIAELDYKFKCCNNYIGLNSAWNCFSTGACNCHIGDNCISNKILCFGGGPTINVSIDNVCKDNYIFGPTNMGKACESNVLLANVENNKSTIGSECKGNIIISHNFYKLGNKCRNNILEQRYASSIYRIELGDECLNNKSLNGCLDDCVLGAKCEDNTFCAPINSSEWISINVGDYSCKNIIGDNSTYAFYGHATIKAGNNFSTNKIYGNGGVDIEAGNYFQNSTFSNTFVEGNGNYATPTTITCGDNCSNIVVQTTSGGFNLYNIITMGNYCSDISITGNSYQNKLKMYDKCHHIKIEGKSVIKCLLQEGVTYLNLSTTQDSYNLEDRFGIKNYAYVIGTGHYGHGGAYPTTLPSYGTVNIDRSRTYVTYVKPSTQVDETVAITND